MFVFSANYISSHSQFDISVPSLDEVGWYYDRKDIRSVVKAMLSQMMRLTTKSLHRDPGLATLQWRLRDPAQGSSQ